MREIEGVAGLHIVVYKQQDLVPEIVAEAGLLPRPVHGPKKEITHVHVTRCLRIELTSSAFRLSVNRLACVACHEAGEVTLVPPLVQGRGGKVPGVRG